ncbi:MAG: insulinase family protein [Bdellovibrionales bacterium]|nr:insulinase family protein [Bdellovibrionales bacterium]
MNQKSLIPSWISHHGIDAIQIPKHDRPLVKFSLIFPTGSFSDPLGKEGLSNFMGDLLLRGTKNKSRDQIESQLDHLGASLNAYIGYHSFMIDGYCLKRNLQDLLELTQEILLSPSFDDGEVEKLKNELYSDFMLRLEDDQDLARDCFSKNLFQGNRYARDVSGNKPSIQGITKSDVEKKYKEIIHRDKVLLGVSGDIEEHTFLQLIETLCSSLPEGSREIISDHHVSPIKRNKIFLVDKPERSQTQFFLGHPCLHANHQDLTALQCFANAFAGSIFQAKYMQEIRVKRGWSYGASGGVDAKRDAGSFYLYTFPKTQDTIEAVELSMKLFDQAVHGDLIEDQLLEFSKQYMLRSYPFKIDTPEKVLSRRISDRLLDRPEGYFESYVDRVSALSLEQMRDAAKAHLDPKHLIISILCTAKDLEGIENRLHIEEKEVIPFDLE